MTDADFEQAEDDTEPEPRFPVPTRDDLAWIALERAVGEWSIWRGEKVSYGRELYGGCLEPGYQEETRTHTTECPSCGRWRLHRRDWEAAEGGSLNFYYSEYCDACGYSDTPDPSEP